MYSVENGERMRLFPYCAACMMKRGYSTITMATKNRKKQIKALRALMALTSRQFNEKGNPSDIGTDQSKIISKALGIRDPFKKIKMRAIRRAKKTLPYFRKKIPKNENARWRFLFLLSICANKIELSAPHVQVDITKLEHEVEECMKHGFGINDSLRIISRIKKAKEILFICDNAGEAPFDLLLIEELEKHAKVYVGVSNSPVDDDITFSEAEEAGLGKKNLIGKGDGFGIMKRYATREIWKKLHEADLIIAKGMANYETLTEHGFLKGKRALLFKVKCPSVAKNCRAKMGENVAMLV